MVRFIESPTSSCLPSHKPIIDMEKKQGEDPPFVDHVPTETIWVFHGFPTSFWSSLPLPRSWRPGRFGTPSTWPCSPPASCTRRGNRTQGARDRPWVQPEATLKRRKKKGGSSAGKMEISPFHPSEMEISPWKIEISPWEIGIYHEKWRGKDQTYGNSWRSNGLGQRKIAQKGCFYQPNIGGSCRCCLQLSLESKDTLLHVCSVCVWVAHWPICKKLCHIMILSLQQQ